MLGVPLLAYALLRQFTDLPLARFDIFLAVLVLIYGLEMLFFFTVMRHPPPQSIDGTDASRRRPCFISRHQILKPELQARTQP